MKSTKKDSLLRMKQVLEIVPLGKSTVWKMVAENKFPQPVKLSERCTAWRESDIQRWMDELTTSAGVN
ncbi:MAG: AlpA family phage regulatory protein [Deltaproteobacteria bacterium]|nr:AlpA family phage regulatory protein [Deltaproteobacteria bacterium]